MCHLMATEPKYPTLDDEHVLSNYTINVFACHGRFKIVAVDLDKGDRTID